MGTSAVVHTVECSRQTVLRTLKCKFKRIRSEIVMLLARTHQTNAFIFIPLSCPFWHVSPELGCCCCMFAPAAAGRFFSSANIRNCLCASVSAYHAQCTHTQIGEHSVEQNTPCDFTNQILNLCKCKLWPAINFIFFRNRISRYSFGDHNF